MSFPNTVCDGSRTLKELRDKFLQPALSQVQVMETLRAEGAKIVHCCYGEADPHIARQLLVSYQSYTGRDTEFRTFCLVCLGSGVLLGLHFI